MIHTLSVFTSSVLLTLVTGVTLAHIIMLQVLFFFFIPFLKLYPPDIKLYTLSLEQVQYIL